MLSVKTTIKICKLIVIIGAVIILIIKMPVVVQDITFNREFEQRMEHYKEHGVSNVTRGGYRVIDSLRCDTVLKR